MPPVSIASLHPRNPRPRSGRPIRPIRRLRLVGSAMAGLTALATLSVAVAPSGSSGSIGLRPTAHTPIPAHDLKHWKLVFADDFRGHSLSSAWGVYGPNPAPSNPGTSYWSPSHARVGHGMLTIVGKQETPVTDEADAGNAGQFARAAFWPVTISYFNENAKSDTLPVYRMSFKLYENGITRDLTMDYGDFVLTGKLTKLELLDKKAAPTCQ